MQLLELKKAIPLSLLAIMSENSFFPTYDPTEIKQSKYCYPGTDVLINKENIRDPWQLIEYEADITMLRQYELESEHVVKGKFGISHFKRIHHYIFQDVYPFTGKFRTEPISKGNTLFCNYLFIEDNLKSIFNELQKDSYLRSLTPKDFSAKAAYYMSEINMIHPFREGNGRCIREFMRQLALSSGYNIEWSLIEQKVLFEATVIAVNGALKPLTDCIFQVVENR